MRALILTLALLSSEPDVDDGAMLRDAADAIETYRTLAEVAEAREAAAWKALALVQTSTRTSPSSSSVVVEPESPPDGSSWARRCSAWA